MLSIPSHQYTDTLDTGSKRDRLAKSNNRKSNLGDRLDEIAIFAFVAFALMYVAAAGYGLFW
jgi:phosphatidylglycerophosphate synthase